MEISENCSSSFNEMKSWWWPTCAVFSRKCIWEKEQLVGLAKTLLQQRAAIIHTWLPLDVIEISVKIQSLVTISKSWICSKPCVREFEVDANYEKRWHLLPWCSCSSPHSGTLVLKGVWFLLHNHHTSRVLKKVTQIETILRADNKSQL